MYEPSEQAVHTAEELAATMLPYLPEAHPVHVADELAAATLPKPPAVQAVQPEVPVLSAL